MKEKNKNRPQRESGGGREKEVKELISENRNTGVSHVCGRPVVRHGYMPVGGQEALIVPPRGVQVGPGAVGGVITPRGLVQHGILQDEEEEEEETGGSIWGNV